MKPVFAFTVLAVLVQVIGCASESSSPTIDAGANQNDTGASGKGYTPFQQANLANQLLRVGVWQSVHQLAGSADFSTAHFGDSCSKWNPAATSPADPKKIASLYVETVGLQGKVKGRQDDHAWAAPLDVGLQIDATLCAAIEAGAKAGVVPRQGVGSIDWHAQVVEKSLVHFYYVSLYHYLVDGSRKGYDEGVGYYGRSLDGAENFGLADVIGEVDGNCGTTYGTQIWDALRAGKGKLDAALVAEGKTGNEDKLAQLTPELKQLAATIDGQVLEALALALGHEMLGLQAKDEPAIELIEARMFAGMLLPYVVSIDKAKGSQHAAGLQSVWQDDPDKVDTAAVLKAINGVWGLDVAKLCK